jgi:hypothetical protein
MKSKRKPVEIVGIVHPLGAGGGRGGQETLWTLRFSFQPWRGADGRIDERRLRVEQPNLSDEKLQDMMALIKPYDILRVRLRVTEAKQADADAVHGDLVELLGKESSDSDLSARAEQLKQPVTVAHPFFGTFTLNRALNWYETEVEWKSQTVRLHLSRDECEDEEALFAMAESLCKAQKKWDQRIRNFAVGELLELKNGLWLGDDEKKFTPRRFKERMRLESISVDPDGSFEFTFDDGNLFWGHVIQVSGTLSEGPTHAGIAG